MSSRALQDSILLLRETYKTILNFDFIIFWGIFVTISKPEKYFEKTPEDLNELRVLVNDWLIRSEKAIRSFQRSDENSKGSFLKSSSSDKNSKLSNTTAARCYMGLVYSDKFKSLDGSPPQWRSSLKSCISNLELTLKNDEVIEKNLTTADTQPLNNFEIAHITDFLFAHDYCERFYASDCSVASWKKQFLKSDRAPNNPTKHLKELLVDRLKDSEHISNGQVFFDKGQIDSRHFFVTLHILRAISILGLTVSVKGEIEKIVQKAKQYCIEQCFYVHRKVRHLQDPARLVFAATIYCLYAEEVDQEVITSAVECITEMQEPNGKWPSSHPITRARQGVKTPWYIASPELALCLTCLLYTSPSPRDGLLSRMPSSA